MPLATFECCPAAAVLLLVTSQLCAAFVPTASAQAVFKQTSLLLLVCIANEKCPALLLPLLPVFYPCCQCLQVPVIVSVVVTPPLVSAGQSFLVTVTLEAPIPWGKLTFTSDPPDIICPVVHITSADNPIPVMCTTPQATAVLSAGLLGTAHTSGAEQAAQLYADAVESSAEPAAPEAAVQVASQASVASSQQARVAQQQLSGSTAYTLTATVTADTVAEADADVQVGMQGVWHTAG